MFHALFNALRKFSDRIHDIRCMNNINLVNQSNDQCFGYTLIIKYSKSRKKAFM